jgi:hypothetical protein
MLAVDRWKQEGVQLCRHAWHTLSVTSVRFCGVYFFAQARVPYQREAAMQAALARTLQPHVKPLQALCVLCMLLLLLLLSLQT